MFDYDKTSDVGVYKHLLAFIKESLILTKEEKENLAKKYFEKRKEKWN